MNTKILFLSDSKFTQHDSSNNLSYLIKVGYIIICMVVLGVHPVDEVLEITHQEITEVHAKRADV